MNMNEIERALRELRLSGIAATLDTRVMQAQATQEPFLDTFAAMLQDELDRRHSRLMERRFKHSRLDERPTLADFDWRFNPKLPRAACFELHTLEVPRRGRQRPDHRQARHRQEPRRQGCGLPGHPAGPRRALRGGRQRVRALRAGDDAGAGRAAASAGSTPTCWCSTICSWRGASASQPPSCCRPLVHQRYKLRAQHRRHLQPGRAGLGQVPRRRHHGAPPSWTASCTAAPCWSSRARATG